MTPRRAGPSFVLLGVVLLAEAALFTVLFSDGMPSPAGAAFGVAAARAGAGLGSPAHPGHHRLRRRGS